MGEVLLRTSCTGLRVFGFGEVKKVSGLGSSFCRRRKNACMIS